MLTGGTIKVIGVLYHVQRTVLTPRGLLSSTTISSVLRQFFSITAADLAELGHHFDLTKVQVEAVLLVLPFLGVPIGFKRYQSITLII